MEEIRKENKWYKDKKACEKFFYIITIAELLLMIVPMLIDIFFHTYLCKYYSDGRIEHYLFLIIFMTSIWVLLADGKITQLSQILLFFVIPISEFIILNIIGLSNWWGLLFIFIYSMILTKMLDIDLENKSSSHSNNGELSGKFFESLVKGLIRKL